MKIREMKVQEHITPAKWNKPMRRKPKLVIAAKWLEECGIYAGDRVTITQVENQLIISTQ
ncbi:MAG: hypothetical protein PF694_09230 [Bacteroidetes bacterium]|jgi:hypothetical protein|nr:hypothetical protein [Bacteroidota bacterium]